MGFEHSFFKVIRSSEKMEVPPAFAWQMGGAPCMLRDASKNVWLVEVSSQDDKWYFHKGWAELFREKSLNVGDILLFEYLGNNLFHFKLFGEGESNNSGRGEQEEKEEHRESEQSEENDDYVKEDEDDDDDDDDDYEKEEEDDVSECERKDEQLHTSKKIKLGDETLQSKRRYKEQKILDCYGEEIFKSGLASRPDNPYFVSRSRSLTRKNELYIPKDVIVDYQLNIPKKMYMVDERGRKWETKTHQWKDGRVWCTQGWKSLCKVNKIKTDDICICEFQGRDKDMSLLVHVHVLDKLL